MFVPSSFLQVAGVLDAVINKNSDENIRNRVDLEFAQVQLEDIGVIATLGVGGFGRVELVSMDEG